MAQAAANNKPKVTVVLVTYESGPTLGRCLAALRAQSFTDFELVLVDNASRDGAGVAAAAADPAIRLIANDANLGFAAAVNQGVAAASGRWIALLNPDAYAAADWLAELMAATETFPHVRSFGSRQTMAGDPGRLDGLGDAMSITGFPFRGGYRGVDPGPLPPFECFSACGGAMLIDRMLFLEMGGLDERLFCYNEDVDLGYRLRLIGEATVIVPSAVVAHEGSASSGGPRSDFAVFHGTRNRLWVFVKDTPPILFWLTLPLHLIATATLFARHATRGELAAPWRGFLAGLAGLPMVWRWRREAQGHRRASSVEVARAMTFSARDLLLRRVVRKPIAPAR
ncbi:glycosyltransferase family 2 protein [Phenylobacterium immobile]|uniref:glycosyltransferase family 2 protein n=1 Tax=Phenylobacterium immobile TaxID=21 RepID=UPI000AEEB4F6|nr:glycosyltransferase family 2 protein [Phenylobacterium immobile]